MAEEEPDGLHCDHHGCATPEELLDFITSDTRAKIDEFGFTVIATQDDGGRWLTYTVGLNEHGRPEVYVRGLPPETAHPMLADLGLKAIREGDELAAGARADLIAQYVMQLVPSNVVDAHLGVVKAMYGLDVPVMQLVWPDNTGAYPWDDTYAAEVSQPRMPRP